MLPRRIAAVLALLAAGACVNPDTVVVTGAGPDDLLKLRDGPGLNYRILLGLPDGTRLTRQDCVTSYGKLWCKVSLVDRPGVTGYVAADYLGNL